MTARIWLCLVFFWLHIYGVSLALEEFCISSNDECFLSSKEEETTTKTCQLPDGLGVFDVDLSIKTPEEISSILSEVTSGGTWRPLSCVAAQRVAILIPYRDRWNDLLIFINNVHEFVQHQNLVEYRIFVVEQADSLHFNRGALFNAGFLHSLEFGTFDCYILHDVDKYPEVLTNSYSCGAKPRVLISQKRFEHEEHHKPYVHQPYFGGVVAITCSQYQRVNGFSNRFWGWGSEDDDFRDRVMLHGLEPDAVGPDIGKYVEIWHSWGYVNPNRHKVRSSCKGCYAEDGITSLKYEVTSVHEELLYTHIAVQLHDTEVDHS